MTQHPVGHYSIGVDPGANGGICILSPDLTIYELRDMPETEIGIWTWLDHHVSMIRLHTNGTDTRFKGCVEKVGGYIGPKRRFNKKGEDNSQAHDPGSDMFVFGKYYGWVTMALTALDIYPYLNPVPRTWQAAIGISPREKTEDGPAFKRRLKQKAQELYPNEKRITLKTCDALLLAYFTTL